MAEALKIHCVSNVRLSVEAAGEEGATEEPSWRRVDLKVGDGRPQDVAAHEFGHMLGLDDDHDDAGHGRGGSITRTGKPAGHVNRHEQLARDIGVSGGAVHENNDGLMSLGTNVKPADYATMGWRAALGDGTRHAVVSVDASDTPEIRAVEIAVAQGITPGAVPVEQPE